MLNVKHCSCGMDVMKGQRVCKVCHAKYMRRRRIGRRLSEEGRYKDICRSYLGVYLKRGKVKKDVCLVCGGVSIEAHHEDYSKPLEVVWLCRKHHLELEIAKKACINEHMLKRWGKKEVRIHV